jgi:hypothetical protein
VNVAQRLGCLKYGWKDIMNHRWFNGFDWGALATRKMKPPWLPDLKADDDSKFFDTYAENLVVSHHHKALPVQVPIRK